MKIVHGFTFDDVLLIPKLSNIESRSNIDLSIDLGKGVKLFIPIVSANMKNVTGPEMARKIAELGGLAILHRFDNMDNCLNNYIVAMSDETYRYKIGASIGIHEHDKKLAEKLIKLGCKIIVVDVAHGHHENVRSMCQYIKNNYPDVLLISGNVATPNGAEFLRNCGSDVIKIGVGPGSLCSTRIETGNGVPQLSALDNIYQTVGSNTKIIADGGIKSGGDLTKCLCFSHAVMLGNMLAGTDEAPGDIILVDGKRFKQYAGSSTHKSKHVEGVIGLVPYRGSVTQVVTKLTDGLRSGMSYQGANNLSELRSDPEFVLISNAGLTESHPHDVRY